jgi:hypothetical protein
MHGKSPHFRKTGCICYSLTIECPSKAHVLKAWSPGPSGGEVIGGRVFEGDIDMQPLLFLSL